MPFFDTLNPYPEVIRSSVISAAEDLDIRTEFLPDISKFSPDIIHIQWVEEWFRFFNRHHSDPAAAMVKWLKSHQNHSKLIATVHNLKPHRSIKGMPDHFHKEIYGLCNGLIHLGEVSVKLLSGSAFEKIPHTIILHPSTQIPLESTSGFQTRFFPGGSSKRFVLVPGKVRTREEALFLNRLSGKSKVEHCFWIVPKYYFPTFKYFPRILNLGFILLRKAVLNLSDQRSYGSFYRLETDQLDSLLKATDLVFIPRLHQINSGLVSLAFNYEKVVVGPDHGNTGWLLRKTGNPTFQPDDAGSVGSALEKGFQLSHLGKGGANMDFMKENATPELTAASHIRFYHMVLDRKF